MVINGYTWWIVNISLTFETEVTLSEMARCPIVHGLLMFHGTLVGGWFVVDQWLVRY